MKERKDEGININDIISYLFDRCSASNDRQLSNNKKNRKIQKKKIDKGCE
ncbi:hypothetical protein ACTXLQ_00385 [Enterococcus hirae]|nr:hypothetical protein [Enterococcus hirae]EMF0615946.1 hypothetical protein [Enterococcus hirae]